MALLRPNMTKLEVLSNLISDFLGGRQTQSAQIRNLVASRHHKSHKATGSSSSRGTPGAFGGVKQRMKNATQHQPCPCGSGHLFMYCCGR